MDNLNARVKLSGKILYSDEHGHAIIYGEDEDLFLAAGWIFAGTVSKDIMDAPLIRMRKP